VAGTKREGEKGIGRVGLSGVFTETTVVADEWFDSPHRVPRRQKI
jgi:hypothetical protein